MPLPEPSAVVENITPTQAFRYLEGNTRNRSIRDQVVDQYARDMKAGKWQLTGEAVKFANDGTLLDGQHRLWAITRAEVPVKMFVIRGVRNSSQDVMDSGIKRSSGDALNLAGYQCANIVASTARLAIAIDNGVQARHGQGLGRNSAASHSEIIDWVEANPSVEDAAKAAVSRYSKTIEASPTVLSYCLWRLRQVNPEKADEFFDSMSSMSTDGPGDPRLALLRFFMRSRRDRVKISSTIAVSAVFRAWNAWRKGRDMSHVRTEIEGKPVPIPDPSA